MGLAGEQCLRRGQARGKIKRQKSKMGKEKDWERGRLACFQWDVQGEWKLVRGKKRNSVGNDL